MGLRGTFSAYVFFLGSLVGGDMLQGKLIHDKAGGGIASPLLSAKYCN